MLRKRLFALICVLCITLTGVIPVHSETDSASHALDIIFASTESRDLQKFANGFMTENVGKGAEWYAVGINKLSSSTDLKKYRKALEKYLDDKEGLGAVTKQKYALALIACGGESHPLFTDALENTIGAQGIMSNVFGLHFLTNGLPSSVKNTDTVISDILQARLPDGGYAVSGEKSDPDVTAMAIQALAPYYASNEAVKDAVDGALAALSEMQTEDGNFLSYGVANSESTAQVIIALTLLGIDPDSDARFIKNGRTLTDVLLSYRLADGTYCHTLDGKSNANATVQAFLAYVSMDALECGKSGIYTFSELNYLPNEYGGSLFKSYKPFAVLATVLVSLLSCVILIIKKHPLKDILPIGVIALIIVSAILFINIKPPKEYETPEGEPVGAVMFSVTGTDGVQIEKRSVSIYEGDTAHSVLLRECRKEGLSVDSSGGYVSGIGVLSEFDKGALSGWVYIIDGVTLSSGSNEYVLKDGQALEWHYKTE